MLDQQNAVAEAKASALPTNLGSAEEMKVSPDLFGQYAANKKQNREEIAVEEDAYDSY